MRQENAARIRIHSMQMQHAVEHSSSPRKHVGDGWQVPRPAVGQTRVTIRMANLNLTDMVCYVSPTREPRGLGSAWGPARFARSRGRNGVCVCKLLSTTSTRRPTLTGRATDRRKRAPAAWRQDRTNRAFFSHPDINTSPRNFPISNPAQYSSGLLDKGPQKNTKKREKRVRNSFPSPPVPLPSIMHTNPIKCGRLSGSHGLFFSF
jgi:hypothetical protein